MSNHVYIVSDKKNRWHVIAVAESEEMAIAITERHIGIRNKIAGWTAIRATTDKCVTMKSRPKDEYPYSSMITQDLRDDFVNKLVQLSETITDETHPVHQMICKILNNNISTQKNDHQYILTTMLMRKAENMSDHEFKTYYNKLYDYV